MRLSNALFVTQRETPSEAELTSHQLLLRAGFIRRVGSGTYAYLPLLQRVLHKLHDIIRQELAAIGAQECLLPQLQSADLWRESGRWDSYTQAEGIMFALTDRQGREQALGPTHEEVVTFLARDLIRSYRQLPVHLYQIQTKFRDEIRPRFGLLRAREFTMKDGYSFHATPDDLHITFEQVGEAYARILDRAGVRWRAVQADSGAIGGSNSREFMVLAQAGEDEVLYTDDGVYAANSEKAESRLSKAWPSPFQAFEKRATPNAATIESICRLLSCHASNVVKNVLYEAHLNGVMVPVLVSVRGDQTVNETKLANVITQIAPTFGADTLLRLVVPSAEQQRAWLRRNLPLGYLSPDLGDEFIADVPSVAAQFLRLVDRSAAELTNFVTGANESEVHVVGANWTEQFTLPPSVVDVRLAREGDTSLHDASQRLRSARGIEVGIFSSSARSTPQPCRQPSRTPTGTSVPCGWAVTVWGSLAWCRP
ncbi:proline--tRNA ligase [Deinococcus peraridilitoris]|uniref:proline--tRNA ligase n=1 Tax=Deinococcus peraridilitoris TaxID=432329 RepID=UPI0002FE466A|nr:proline--tRNA ligase [Deinococcus peraridilitoris]